MLFSTDGYQLVVMPMITDRVEKFNEYMKGYVERIRNLIPKEALEEEQKAMEYGKQQSLI